MEMGIFADVITGKKMEILQHERELQLLAIFPIISILVSVHKLLVFCIEQQHTERLISNRCRIKCSANYFLE